MTQNIRPLQKRIRELEAVDISRVKVANPAGRQDTKAGWAYLRCL